MSRSGRKRMIRPLVYLFIFAAAIVFISSLASVVAIVAALPDPDELFSRRIVQSTKIYDRTEKVLLYDIHGEERRTVVTWNDIPAVVKNATVVTEDANFWSHRGIDFRGILRAAVVDLISRDIRQGGSTITQQLVKNALVGRERSFRRKIKEAILAVMMEYRLSKENILELYLNQIPYGSNAYGIAAAAETFFGKKPNELTLAEAALLSALPRAPSYYSPYGQHSDKLKERQLFVIRRLEELGYASSEEAEAAAGEPLRFLPAARNIRAPHFIMYIREYLVNKYGEEEVESGGLKVITTLDWRLQEEAERLVRGGAEKNEKLIKAYNMALAALDPKSGEILSMVGSRDYFGNPIPSGCAAGLDCRFDPNVNAAIRPRQPGSAFKPFVYATAFSKGFQPETVLFDLPTEFNPLCSPQGLPIPGSGQDPEKCYHPQNYDEKFRGPVTLRQALAQSLNLPSVKLLYLAGVEDSIRTAEAAGITTLKDRSRFGLSLVLGGGEIKLLELVSGFGVFANDGVRNPATAILRVEGPNRELLEEKKSKSELVIDPEVARLISDILSDNESRIPTFQRNSSLYFPDRKVAAKTGTTQDYRDAWTIGYTPSLAVGVWAGNNDNTPSQQKGSGVLAAAPTWRAFMEFAVKDTPPEDFPTPGPREIEKPVLKGLWQGDTVVAIDRISGKKATPMTPPETIIDVAYGQPRDPLFWISRRDPTGPPPENPASDPQYENWSWTFAEWLKSSGFRPKPLSDIPTGTDDVHIPEKIPAVLKTKIEETEDSYRIDLDGKSFFPLREVSFFDSHGVIHSIGVESFPVSVAIKKDDVGLDVTSLLIKIYDSVGNVGEVVARLR